MKARPVSRLAKSKRPVYFHDPATDKLMAMLLTVVAELSVTRERLDACERLLEQRGVMTRDDIDRFVPDTEAEQERAAARTDYIERVMRIVTMELQRPDDSGATESFTRTLEGLLSEDL